MNDFLSLYFLHESEEVEVYDPKESRVFTLRKGSIDDLLRDYKCLIVYDAFDFYYNFTYPGKVIDIKLIVNTLLECTDLKTLHDQYYDDECTQFSKIIYKLYELYKGNGAFSFILEKHDLYLIIIKNYATSVKKKVFSLDIDAIVKKRNSLNNMFNEVVDRLSFHTGYKVNIRSRLDLEDLLFNKLSLSRHNYSENDLKEPFTCKSLCKLKNEDNVVCDILYVKKLLRDLKTINSVIDLSQCEYHYSHSVKSNTSISIECDSFDANNLFCEDFLPFSSSEYNLFHFQLVEPELYTLFKWSLDSKLSEHYENGNSLNKLISDFLNIDYNKFNLFIDIVFSKCMKKHNEIYLFSNQVCDYEDRLTKFLGIKSLRSFLERVKSFYSKKKYIRSFNGSPVFPPSGKCSKSCILYTVGRLSVLENIYKIVNSLPDDIYLVHSYHRGFVFASNHNNNEIHSLFTNNINNINNVTYPFKYNFHINRIGKGKL